MATPLEETAHRLSLTRVALGYGNQAAFASALGMSPQRWNAYEKGREPLPMPVALQLCATYGVNLDWLFRGLKDGLPSRLRAEIDKLEAGTNNPRQRRRR